MAKRGNGLLESQTFQEETGNLNRPTTANKMQSVIKELPTNKSPGPDVCTVEVY